MKQAHVFISGIVQGIGYRYFVKSWARSFSIVGWVTNLPDGRVEGVFQGKKERIEQLIEQCRKGPFLADVKDVVVSWEDVVDEFGGFRIIS